MERNLLVELLQIALGNRSSLSSPSPSVSEWGMAYVEALRQAAVGVLFIGLDRLPAEQRPPQKILLQWIGQVQLNETAYALHCRRARELTTEFAKYGFNSSVLKGLGFSQLYPMPSRRQCGDIDLWVDGDRKTVMQWLRSRFEIDHVVWHHVDAKVFEDASTEVHFHPGWLYNPFYNNRLQKWFHDQKDNQMRVNEELGFAYPTVQFNAVYSLVHLYHHLIEEGIGIRHIVDYYYILKALPGDERSFVLADLKSFGMYKVTAAMMWVLQKVCGLSSEHLLCEPDENEGLFVLEEVMDGGNFGQYRKDSRRRNTAARFLYMLPHYPKEVLWVFPWKAWHKCWRLVNDYDLQGHGANE